MSISFQLFILCHQLAGHSDCTCIENVSKGLGYQLLNTTSELINNDTTIPDRLIDWLIDELIKINPPSYESKVCSHFVSYDSVSLKMADVNM